MLHHLEFDFGFEITAEREFSKATLRVGKQSEFDIAVIDLSWSGDSALPRGKRSNVGLKLIDMLDTGKSSVPVIAFSQNFRDDRALMLQVTRRNAFPMQKYYSDIDYHALGSAILYLTRHLRRDKSESRAENHVGSTFWDVVRLIPRMYLLIVIVLILCIVAGLAHINTTPGEPVKVFGIEVYNKAPSK